MERRSNSITDEFEKNDFTNLISVWIADPKVAAGSGLLGQNL